MLVRLLDRRLDIADGSCDGTLCKISLRFIPLEVSIATWEVKGLTLAQLPVRKRKTHGTSDEDADANVSDDEL